MMLEKITRLAGANLDIDLITNPDQIEWTQAQCPWNLAENATSHRCATKNISMSDSHPDPFYARTRAFYFAMVFHKLDEFKTLWGAANPCLQLIKGLR